jgi:Heterokaryon incompatibility protein (HET)
MDPDAPGIYSALEAQKQEIRILRLNAGDRAAQISGSLVISSIDLAPKYEALSYAWGSSEMSNTILLNGQVFPVTDNLHTALVYLRTDTERLLWMDAICIYPIRSRFECRRFCTHLPPFWRYFSQPFSESVSLCS